MQYHVGGFHAWFIVRVWIQNVYSWAGASRGFSEQICVIRSFQPDFVLVRQHARNANDNWKHTILGLHYGGVPSVNSLESVFNFLDRPWVVSRELHRTWQWYSPRDNCLASRVFFLPRPRPVVDVCSSNLPRNMKTSILWQFLWLGLLERRELSHQNITFIFIPSDLDLWPLDLKFTPLVTLVHLYVSTNSDVTTAFLFRENRRDGRTDRRTECNT